MIWFIFGMLLKIATCGPCDYGIHGCYRHSVPCKCEEYITCVPVACIGGERQVAEKGFYTTTPSKKGGKDE